MPISDTHRETMRSVIQDLIHDRTAQADMAFKPFFADKMRTVLGTGISSDDTGNIDEPQSDDLDDE